MSNYYYAVPHRAPYAHTSHTSGGIGFLGALCITFIVLKLTGVINWSWWLVTLPAWGGFALVAALFLGIGVIVALAALVGAALGRR